MLGYLPDVGDRGLEFFFELFRARRVEERAGLRSQRGRLDVGALRLQPGADGRPLGHVDRQAQTRTGRCTRGAEARTRRDLVFGSATWNQKNMLLIWMAMFSLASRTFCKPVPCNNSGIVVT